MGDHLDMSLDEIMERNPGNTHKGGKRSDAPSSGKKGGKGGAWKGGKAAVGNPLVFNREEMRKGGAGNGMQFHKIGQQGGVSEMPPLLSFPATTPLAGEALMFGGAQPPQRPVFSKLGAPTPNLGLAGVPLGHGPGPAFGNTPLPMAPSFPTEPSIFPSTMALPQPSLAGLGLGMGGLGGVAGFPVGLGVDAGLGAPSAESRLTNALSAHTAMDEQSATDLLDSAKQVASTISQLGHRPQQLDGILASLATLQRGTPGYVARAVDLATAVSTMAATAGEAKRTQTSLNLSNLHLANLDGSDPFAKPAGPQVRKIYSTEGLVGQLGPGARGVGAGGSSAGSGSGVGSFGRRAKNDPRSIDMHTVSFNKRMDQAKSSRAAAKAEQLARMRGVGGSGGSAKKVIRDESQMTNEEYAQQGRTHLKLKARFDLISGIK